MAPRRLCALALLAGLTFAADPALNGVFDAVGIGLEQYTMHDPSRVVTGDARQLVAATGKAQEDGYACGLETWHRANPKKMWEPAQCLFVEKPHWIKDRIPSQSGAFWAPELINATAMYYSVADFTDESAVTCVGLATATGTFPDKLTWKDSGEPVACVDGEDWEEEVSAIDPTFLRASDGRAYLVTGGGRVHGIEVDPNTLRPKQWDHEDYRPEAPGWSTLARGPDGEGWVEAAYVHEHEGYFYLFVNWGSCCSGVDSTYNIRVGRSKQPMGPYTDKYGKDMHHGGGSLFLDERRYLVGPGHTAVWADAEGKEFVSFHFYDRRRNGAPWIAERELKWKNGWPRVGKIMNTFQSKRASAVWAARKIRKAE